VGLIYGKYFLVRCFSKSKSENCNYNEILMVGSDADRVSTTVDIECIGWNNDEALFQVSGLRIG
jgi:hypothetical protein